MAWRERSGDFVPDDIHVRSQKGLCDSCLLAPEGIPGRRLGVTDIYFVSEVGDGP